MVNWHDGMSREDIDHTKFINEINEDTNKEKIWKN